MSKNTTGGCSRLRYDICKNRETCTWVTGKGCRKRTSPALRLDAVGDHKQQQQQQSRKRNPCRKLAMATCRSMPECVWVPREGCHATDKTQPAGTAYYSFSPRPHDDSSRLAHAHRVPLPMSPPPVTHHEHPPQPAGTHKTKSATAPRSTCSTDMLSYIRTIGGIKGAFRRFVHPPPEVKKRMQVLGSGVYGLVLSTVDLDECFAYFKRKEAKSTALLGDWSAIAERGAIEVQRSEWNNTSGTAAIKVQVIRSREHLEATLAEDAFHLEVMKNPLLSKYVPRLYAGFTICSKFIQAAMPPATCSTQLPGMVFRITLMEQLNGYTTLCDFAESARHNTPVLKESRYKLYADIRQLLLRMWSAGIAHGDLHCNNIMLDPTTLDLKLLDFGMAMRLKPETSAKCKTTLLAFESRRYDEARQSYRACEHAFMEDAKIAFRDFNWYHPDPHMLRVVRLWASNPLRKLYTVNFNPGTQPPPTMLNPKMQQLRNAQNLNVFFNK